MNVINMAGEIDLRIASNSRLSFTENTHAFSNVCEISVQDLHLHETFSVPSPKSHIICSGNQSNSAEKVTSFHTGACLDG